MVNPSGNGDFSVFPYPVLSIADNENMYDRLGNRRNNGDRYVLFVFVQRSFGRLATKTDRHVYICTYDPRVSHYSARSN